MSVKWQGFLIGLFAGILLSGTIILFLDNRQSDHRAIYPASFTVQGQISTTETAYSNEGKININTATIDELSSLPGIGPSKAKAIVDFRSKYGFFNAIDELLYVPGIGESLFHSINDEIFVELP